MNSLDLDHPSNLLIIASPTWLIRSGISSLAFVIIMIMILSSFIKYPDKIVSHGIVTSANPPIEHFVTVDGNIDSLFSTNKQRVNKGDKILLINNPGRIADIEKLEHFIKDCEDLSDAASLSTKKFPSGLKVGEIQKDYALLELLILDLQLKLKESYVFRKVEILNSEINRTESLIKNLINQKQIAAEELILQEQGYLRDKTLHSNNVLSDLDIEKSRIELLKAQKQFSVLENGVITNQIKVEQLKLEIYQINESKVSLQNTSLLKIQETVAIIKHAISVWRQKYLVLARIDGILTLKSEIIPKVAVSEKQIIATILPDGATPNRFVRSIAYEKDGIGKINIGDKVILKINGYPYKEFGVIKSEVLSISVLPDMNSNGSSTYEVLIPLPEKLVTSYGVFIPGSPNTGVVAEIITEDKSILRRIFNQFYNLLIG